MTAWLYRWLPIVFGCHCREDRSFHIRGRRLPLCARCTGELAGILGCLVSAPFVLPPVPLVLVMHGYTASMYAIAEESRWYDVAEENGFIVVFAQGLVRPADAMGNIPTAMWLAGSFSALGGEGTDPDADIRFIDTLLDRYIAMAAQAE